MKLTPREYQKRIFETCTKKNCLVVLPTGLGKTLIALMLAKERVNKFPGSKILFLAPTRPLVEQHYHSFKKDSDFENMHIFTGKINSKKRKEIWKNAQIIFSTPQCIQNDLKNHLIDLKEVSLLIEDEAHRCLKNYSYTFVAKKYIDQAKNSRLLGLTASPSSEKEKIREICKNLDIKDVEIRTRFSEDVKPYLQELTTDIIKVEFPPELKAIRSFLKKIYDKKIDELKKRKFLFQRVNKITLLDLQKNLMRKITTGNKHFNILRAVSICAQAIKIQHALELLETQTVETLNYYLQGLYDQARKKQSKGVVRLVNSKEFQEAYLLAISLKNTDFEHPKLERLKELIKEEFKEGFKAIVFSQYRDSVNKINKELTSAGFKSNVFIGQASGRLDGLSQKEQQQILQKFKDNKINMLVSTSIGEEGLDIPEVNMVVFYEPVPSAIRKIQRRGRTARLKPGKLVILMTKGTRDESYHWAAHYKEKKMHEALEDFKNGLQKKQKDFSDFRQA
ncbi:MAG: DEAD/DEAH box helicase [archaeon]|nr:MAG: DEAD/DEAH box helicase [archaeon]